MQYGFVYIINSCFIFGPNKNQGLCLSDLQMIDIIFRLGEWIICTIARLLLYIVIWSLQIYLLIKIGLWRWPSCFIAQIFIKLDINCWHYQSTVNIIIFVQVCDFGLSKMKHSTFLSSRSTAGTVSNLLIYLLCYSSECKLAIFL